MTWWETDQWLAYERICGAESRVEVLAAATWQTRVVTLLAAQADQWRGLRKSAKALIHRAERDSAIRVGVPADIEGFRRLHLELAGRETRPAASWALMAEWVRDGTLVLVVAAQGGQDVAYAAAYVWGEWSYYGHAAARRGLVVGHALVWRLMREAQARGAVEFEAGWQGQDATAKGRGIEQFRRAFGGVDVPVRH